MFVLSLVGVSLVSVWTIGAWHTVFRSAASAYLIGYITFACLVELNESGWMSKILNKAALLDAYIDLSVRNSKWSLFVGSLKKLKTRRFSIILITFCPLAVITYDSSPSETIAVFPVRLGRMVLSQIYVSVWAALGVAIAGQFTSTKWSATPRKVSRNVARWVLVTLVGIGYATDLVRGFVMLMILGGVASALYAGRLKDQGDIAKKKVLCMGDQIAELSQQLTQAKADLSNANADLAAANSALNFARQEVLAFQKQYPRNQIETPKFHLEEGSESRENEKRSQPDASKSGDACVKNDCGKVLGGFRVWRGCGCRGRCKGHKTKYKSDILSKYCWEHRFSHANENEKVWQISIEKRAMELARAPVRADPALEAQQRSTRVEQERIAKLRTFYHGTSLESALGIQKTGFRVDLAGSNAGTMLGIGVYCTTTLEKALNYAKRSEGGGIVFVLKVDVGKCLQVKRRDPRMKTWHTLGFDSAFSGEGVNGEREEHCVRDPKRVHIISCVMGHTRRANMQGYRIVDNVLVCDNHKVDEEASCCVM
eukprot:m.13673 g.13673  ORF g.13673 m.13673 type:complete len:540 (+) comp9807_c0_seq1:427-2046(+)